MAEKYLENIKFLVVDDNAFMRTIVRRVLGALDVKLIKEATDGTSALKIMQTFEPDIAIVDWEMQPLDGLEFTQMVRTDDDSPNPFLPIIMLSGHAEQSRIVAARDAGINEFVIKPISVKTLFSRIQEVIERPRPFVRAKSYFGPDRRRKNVKITFSDRRAKPPVKNDPEPADAETAST